jgi:hypothetical protein
MILGNQEKKWFKKNYPTLNVGNADISGEIFIKATYNKEKNRFLNLTNRDSNDIGGLVLAGEFKINIKERIKEATSRLPALTIEGVEHISARHLNKGDDSACLCSPLEEDEYLLNFKTETFFEELVVPFLYGQLYYDKYTKWPWGEYAHGSPGIFESYAKLQNSVKLQECIRLLRTDLKWNYIKSLLLQKSPIGGHVTCFCDEGGKMRKCHPDALEGIRKLRDDLMIKNISI